MKTAKQPRGRARRTAGGTGGPPEAGAGALGAAMAKRLDGTGKGKGKGGATPPGGASAAAAADRGAANRKRGARVRTNGG